MRRAPSAAAALALALVGISAAAVAAEWTPFGADAEAVCADGSEVDYLERRADPSRVVLYLEGGGGCFSAATCAFNGPDKAYTSQSLVTPEYLDDRGGMFDFEDERNPLAEYSFVYVPYCTGDIHLGNTTTTYAPDLVVEHRGYPNGLVAIEHLAANYPEATEVVVAGSSGGSPATPLYAGLIADHLPAARITTLGDSSGAYPDEPVLNAVVGMLWGTMEAVPDWPEVEGMTVREWSIPGLYRVVARHAPDISLGKFDYAFDEAQAFYGQLVGLEPEALVTLIDEVDEDIEAGGAVVSSYVAPGSEHTILGSEEFYTLEVEGVRFLDWLTELVEGDRPADVHCVDCR